MMRSLSCSFAAIALGTSSLAGQLPYLTAPAGTLRIQLDGGFTPTSREYADGTSRRLGDPIGTSGALEGDLAVRLTQLLGRPASPASTGDLTADLMHQRGEGGVGLAIGISSRLTASVRLPIVSVRTESRLQQDDATATLGINPTVLGDGTSAAWLSQFANALTELQQRRDAGEYANDPPLQALADDILTNAPAWQAGIADLLVDAGRASLLLPLATSTDGVALLGQAATYRDQLSQSLGVTAPAGLPALPAQGMTSAQFNELLTDPLGFGLAPVEEQPFVGIGDAEVGVVYALLSTANPARRRWFGAWVTGGLTLPTGTPPRADRLRDQGTGDGQLDVRIGGVIELGTGRLGLRGEGGYVAQLSGTREARVGGRDAFLLPAARQTSLEWNPGDVLTLSARPFVRIADRLAITGSATWFRRGEDVWSEVTASPLASAVTTMGDGTDGSALRLGLGLSYAHDGSHVDGVRRMPVEAGLMVERTAWSGSGLVAQELATRMWFRVYKRLW